MLDACSGNLIICLSLLLWASCLPQSPLSLKKVLLPGGVLFIYKQTTNHLATFFFGSSYSKPLYTCLNHPRARYQTLGTPPMFQSSLKSFMLANPKPAYSASPIPFYRHHNINSCPQFPSSLSLMANVFPCVPTRQHGIECSLFLGTVSNKLSFNKNCFLIC